VTAGKGSAIHDRSYFASLSAIVGVVTRIHSIRSAFDLKPNLVEKRRAVSSSKYAKHRERKLKTRVSRGQDRCICHGFCDERCEFRPVHLFNSSCRMTAAEG
jgi:hypothetical protein